MRSFWSDKFSRFVFRELQELHWKPVESREGLGFKTWANEQQFYFAGALRNFILLSASDRCPSEMYSKLSALRILLIFDGKVMISQ